MPIRVVNEFAWHNLFARNMFLPENDPPTRAARIAPSSRSSTARTSRPTRRRHGTRSEVFILVHFGRKLVLIGGTHYAGEIKKSIFTILNYTLPLQGVLLDALLGQHRRRAATRRSSSDCRAPARRRSRAIRSGG